MLVVAVALALLQESPTPRALADAVDERNIAESFRAISQLVDLADTRRDEVEKEAARLPSFYREVLLSELKTKRELGDRFGRGLRINLVGMGKTLWEYLEEVGRQPGMGIQINEWNRQSSKETFDVRYENVWAIEALINLCDRTNHRVSGAWEGKLSVQYRGHPITPYKPRPWFFYRNIAVSHPGIGMTKVIDFSGPPRWVAGLWFEIVLGPETKPVLWTTTRLIEAVADDGRTLEPPQEQDTAIPGYSHTSEPRYPLMVPGISLLLPDDKVQSVKRLRFCVVARIATAYRHYVIDEPLKTATAGDEYFEVTLREPETPDSWGPYPEIHVRPKKTAHADLTGIPCTVLYRFEANSGAPGSNGFVFSGKGESMVARTPFGTLRPGARLPGGEKLRQLLRVEVIIPIGLQDRPVYVEFRDIPLR